MMCVSCPFTELSALMVPALATPLTQTDPCLTAPAPHPVPSGPDNKEPNDSVCPK